MLATQVTVTQLISAIRRVRRMVPGAGDVALSACDYDQAGKPTIAWDDPVQKAALVDGLVTDALRLLDALKATSATEQNEALGLLALVAGQDVEQADDGTWRIAERVAPDRVISVVDTEARHMHKSRSEYRDGYKAHVAIEPETGIVTACALTPANTSDATTGVTLLKGEAPGLQVLADGAYGSGGALAALSAAGHDAAIKPFPTPASMGRFHRDDFSVDEAAGVATCPAGHSVVITARRHAVFGIRCRTCPLRTRCTTSSAAGPSSCTDTTRCWSSPEEPGAMATSQRTTGSSGQWSSARSPGSSPQQPARALPGGRAEPSRALAARGGDQPASPRCPGLDHDAGGVLVPT